VITLGFPPPGLGGPAMGWTFQRANHAPKQRWFGRRI